MSKAAFAQEAAFPNTSPMSKAQGQMGQWQWISVPGMTCRDGSSTGIGVRLQPGASAVMIYFQGGGFCADGESCRQNANVPFAGANYGEAKFQNWARGMGQRGIFNTRRAKNPVSKWNHVLIPYCTGDLHGGTRRNAVVPGVAQPQQFVGKSNYAHALKLIAPYFRNASDVGISGSSAGGLGVILNYEQTVQAFGGRSVAALVDSAPVLPNTEFETECLYRTGVNTFGVQIPLDCPECHDPARGGLVNIYQFLAKKYPQGRFALASQDADLAGVILFNKYSRECGGRGVNIFNYRRALLTLRDDYIGGSWSTFFAPGLQHTITQDDGLYFQKRREFSQSMAEWIPSMNRKPPTHLPAKKRRK